MKRAMTIVADIEMHIEANGGNAQPVCQPGYDQRGEQEDNPPAPSFEVQHANRYAKRRHCNQVIHATTLPRHLKYDSGQLNINPLMKIGNANCLQKSARN